MTQRVSSKSFDETAITASALGTTGFPEIEYDKIDKVRGLVVVVTTARPTKAYELLKLMGMPFEAERNGGEDIRRSSLAQRAPSSRCARLAAAGFAVPRLYAPLSDVPLLCFRKLANEGQIPGSNQGSW